MAKEDLSGAESASRRPGGGEEQRLWLCPGHSEGPSASPPKGLGRCYWKRRRPPRAPEAQTWPGLKVGPSLGRTAPELGLESGGLGMAGFPTPTKLRLSWVLTLGENPQPCAQQRLLGSGAVPLPTPEERRLHCNVPHRRTGHLLTGAAGTSGFENPNWANEQWFCKATSLVLLTPLRLPPRQLTGSSLGRRHWPASLTCSLGVRGRYHRSSVKMMTFKHQFRTLRARVHPEVRRGFSAPACRSSPPLGLVLGLGGWPLGQPAPGGPHVASCSG